MKLNLASLEREELGSVIREDDWKYRHNNDVQVWWHDHNAPETHADYPYYIVRDDNSLYFICCGRKITNGGIDAMLEDPEIVAGPYTTLDVVKVAWIMMFGR